jgi:hypothetical protein
MLLKGVPLECLRRFWSEVQMGSNDRLPVVDGTRVDWIHTYPGFSDAVNRWIRRLTDESLYIWASTPTKSTRFDHGRVAVTVDPAGKDALAMGRQLLTIDKKGSTPVRSHRCLKMDACPIRS